MLCNAPNPKTTSSNIQMFGGLLEVVAADLAEVATAPPVGTVDKPLFVKVAAGAVDVAAAVDVCKLVDTFSETDTSAAQPRMITFPTPSGPTSMLPVAVWPELVILILCSMSPELGEKS